MSIFLANTLYNVLQNTSYYICVQPVLNYWKWIQEQLPRIFRGVCLFSSDLVSHSVCFLSSVTLFQILHLLYFFQVLSNSFKSYQVISGHFKSFQVLPSPPKSFQVSSCPSKSFQVLPSPSNSFQVHSSPSKSFQVLQSPFKYFQVLQSHSKYSQVLSSSLGCMMNDL